MHFKYLATNTISAAVRAVMAFLFLALAVNTADAGETSLCALVAPKYQSKDGKAKFEITLDCASAATPAKPFPVGTDILVGLTVYDGADAKKDLRTGDKWFTKREIDAGPEVQAALKDTAQSKSVQVAGAPKWIVVTDENTASFDFRAEVVRLKRKGKRITVHFQGDQKLMGEKRHFLFAAWPASARTPCEKDSEYSRSGCRHYGYVIGDEFGVDPLAVYPGLEINYFGDEGGWTSERWIVERFR